MGVTYAPAVRDTTRQTPAVALNTARCSRSSVRPGFGYLAREVATAGPSIVLDLNHYLFLFLMVGLLLHWRPRSFVQAITASVTPVGGVLIQYPIYAGIVRVMTEGGLATTLAHFFVSISTQHTYPVMIGIYSAFLGLFIPSAGGKWLIEAPYMLDAAKSLQVHLGWVVQTYNATEALANLIHPFWMLPLVGILGWLARDIVGYFDAAVRGPRAAGAVSRVGAELDAHLLSASASCKQGGCPDRPLLEERRPHDFGSRARASSSTL